MRLTKLQKDFVRFSLLPEVGAVRGKSLLDAFGTPEKVFRATLHEMKKIEGIGDKLAPKIIDGMKAICYESEFDSIERSDIKVVSIFDKEYPDNLKNIYDAPIVLYVKGTLKPEDNYSIAVVGTRRPTFYGQDNARKFSYELAKKGVTVVSGMAKGIDTFSHKGALDAGGRTIAVLGSGINKPYPPENIKLMDEIAKNGAVISEFPVNMPARTQYFPMRNRIISGLALGTLVVEAGPKSGALITAQNALEQNREVFSIPGRIDSLSSRGTLSLIKDGAKLVENVDDILAEINYPAQSPSGNDAGDKKALSEDEKMVFMLIGKNPKYVDQIKESAGMDFGKMSKALISLEMKGKIKELAGKKFIRV